MTASVTPQAGKGLKTLSIPVALVTWQTAAIKMLTSYTAGFEGYFKSLSLLTTTVGTGASASQSLSVTITTAGVTKTPTGGVLTVLLADTTPTGKIVASTEVTQNENAHFYQTSTLDILLAASGTAFTAGSGVLILEMQSVQDF